MNRNRIALVVALLAAGVLLALPHVTPPVRDGDKIAAKATDAPAQLPDSTSYRPLLYLRPALSVGTAPTSDGTRLRLLEWTGGGEPRILRSGPFGTQYSGLTATADTLWWAETTNSLDGKAGTALWSVPLSGEAAPRQLTADTGQMVFFGSQYDLVVAEGALHWVSVPAATTATTELRSMPLAGGPVTVRTIPGSLTLSAWPWLVSAGTGRDDPVELVHAVTGERRKVASAPNELLTCTPAWCRVLLVSATGGPTQFDLKRPDGSGRRRLTSGGSSPALADVALLDRYEVLSVGGGGSTMLPTQKILLYDAERKLTLVVAESAGTVAGRDGFVWWSTGDNETLAWHVILLSDKSLYGE